MNSKILPYLSERDLFNLTMDDAFFEIKKLTNVENHTGFLYFLVNYVYVSHPSMGKVKMSENIYNWQINAAIEFLKNRYVVSKKVRQVGFSTISAAYALWRALFFEAQSIVIVSLTQRDSIVFLERVKFIYDNLPIWLKQKTSEFAKTTVKFDHNHSTITSLPNTADPARGTSVSCMIADEFAMFKTAKLFMGAAVPALAAGSMTPFSNSSMPSQLFLISTLPRNPIENEYLRILHSAAEKTEDSNFKVVDVTVDDIPYYQNEQWLKEQYDLLGPIIYAIEIEGREVYDTENLLLPNYVIELLEAKDPIRCDFLNKDDVDGEGYYKNLSDVAFMREDFDPKFGYIKGLWIWKDPEPGHEYMVTCLPQGQQIITTNGKKNIEDVNFFDSLYSKDGKITKIKNIQKHKVKNENLFSIKLQGIIDPIKFTSEHPIYSSKSEIKREWKNNKYQQRFWNHNFDFYNADEIERGDWIKFPNIYAEQKTSIDEMKNIFSKYKTCRYDFDLPDEFILDDEVWWYIGIWIAEGFISKNSKIHTAHNLEKEKHLIDNFVNIFNKYSRSVSYQERKDGNLLVITTISKHFASFLTKEFGCGAKNKNIPEWVKFLPKKYKLQLIKGYLLGDGCIINSEHSKKRIFRSSFVSISKKLLKDVQDILFSVGVVGSLSLLRRAGKSMFPDGRVCNTQETYQLNVDIHENLKLMDLLNIQHSFQTPKYRKPICVNYISDDNNYIYIRVHNVIVESNYCGYVYNFETENHTYLCEYIAVHNCDIASGRATDYSTIEVFDLMSLEQVAEYKGKIDTERFKDVIQTVVNFYNEAKLSVESTGIGNSVAEHFGTTVNYEKFYWHQKSKKVYNPGFPMSTAIRPQAIANMLSSLSKMIPEKEFTINSIRLINELRSFGYTKSGRIEGLSGNDDLVMALCQFFYLRNMGWAVSDQEMMNELPTYANIEEEKAKEENEKVNSLKYWQERFDMFIDDDTREMLKMVEGSGGALPLEFLEELSRNAK